MLIISFFTIEFYIVLLIMFTLSLLMITIGENKDSS